MMISRWKKILASCLLVTLLLVTTACAPESTSRFDQAQQESTEKGATAVAKDAQTGGDFNKFFPKAGGNYNLVYTQEKKGFAQAKLKQNGQEVALLSVSDTSSNPTAAVKFQKSKDKISGYPMVNQGSTATALLVDDRFQVKVLSKNSAFTASDRADWLSKFDLKGLARLQ
ncbi:MAG: hypothetical protein WBG70_04525 [Spirulinaceae cyanobacterium]